jgi:hypothetical protein
LKNGHFIAYFGMKYIKILMLVLGYSLSLAATEESSSQVTLVSVRTGIGEDLEGYLWVAYNKDVWLKLGPLDSNALASRSSAQIIALYAKEIQAGKYIIHTKTDSWFPERITDQESSFLSVERVNKSNLIEMQLLDALNAYDISGNAAELSISADFDQEAVLSFRRFYKKLKENIQLKTEINEGGWTYLKSPDSVTVANSNTLIYTSKRLNLNLPAPDNLPKQLRSLLGLIKKPFGFYSSLNQGVLTCTQVVVNSNAERAGLHVGDVFIVDGREEAFTSTAAFLLYASTLNEITLQVLKPEPRIIRIERPSSQ